MHRAILLLALVAIAAAIFSDEFERSLVVTEQNVARINSMQNSWRASTDQGGIAYKTVSEMRQFLGAREGGPVLETKKFSDSERVALPDSFDSRDNWPECQTIKEIRDQSACGSCWAFGAAEAISDRYCTYGVNKNLTISAADIAFCCGWSCGSGCNGGYPSAAWSYWVNHGAVDSTCYPYPFPSCDHHVPDSKNPCPNPFPTPTCTSTCKDGSSLRNAKHYGAKSYSVHGEEDIMQEIYQNGPVEAAFSVYSDFPNYKSGVYKRTSNDFLGGHAVKIIGWGVEDGEKYWLVANSWNTKWGDKGFFKILKGVNECGIENTCNAGVPKN